MQPEVETLPLAAGHPQSTKRKFLRDLFDKAADKINKRPRQVLACAPRPLPASSDTSSAAAAGPTKDDEVDFEWTPPIPRKDDWAYEKDALAAKAGWWGKGDPAVPKDGGGFCSPGS